MTKSNAVIRSLVVVLVILIVGVFGVMQTASAHCDAVDGPVVADARLDLEAGKLDRTLKWIYPEQEEEVTAVFKLTNQVKKKGPEASELAERYFFETVVRLHRETENAPYTGLKPAGYNAGPIVKGVDKALETGDISKVEKMVQEQVREGIAKRFADARAKKAHRSHNAEAGRSYVAAYVELMHYIEHVNELAATKSVTQQDAAHKH